MNRRRLPALLALLLAAASLRAGYEMPAYVDGCRSADGRFEITAKQVVKGKSSHGPHKWNYLWKDLQTGETREFPARCVQGGQIRGHLFIAPDGETFALWNHITMWWEQKSHMHAHGHKDVLKKGHPDQDAFRNQSIFKNRLIIYAKDGAILKTLAIRDFLESDQDWKHVLPVFTRNEWLRPYDGLYFKSMARTAYAFTKVSPDYTVLEFQVGAPSSPRPVRVSLVDGSLLDPTAALPKEKTPALMAGAAEVPKSSPAWKESYTPGLDPARHPGSYRIDPAEVAFPKNKAPKKLPEFKVERVELVAKDFLKADTPSWLEKTGKKPEEAGRLVFTDLEANRLHTLPPGAEQPAVRREGATRGRIVKRAFYGLVDGNLSRWDLVNPKARPEPLLTSGPGGGPLSLNDLVVSHRGLVYFTTLKDPEKGRLALFDPATRKTTVLFDGEDHPTLANPNGIALSRGERFLYLGISNYKNRKHSGVYAFPIRFDGTLDLEAGKAKPRFPVKAPDGIATDRQGNVYFTAGPTVHVYTPYAQPIAKIKIPKGSGTNLCFGGHDRFQSTLFITTRNALYKTKAPYGGQ